MRPETAPHIGQKERATQSEPLLDVWTAPVGTRVKCPVCGQIFAKKRKKHYFGDKDACRFAFWNRQRMDFRTINRKLDIIIERLGPRAEIREGE